MQSGRLGQDVSRGSPRPARYKNTDPGRAGSVRPVRCPRSGAPQHRRDNHPLRVPEAASALRTPSRHLEAPSLVSRQACEPPGLRHQVHRTTLRCTRIHRFQTAAISTKISTQTGSSLEPICYTCWSRPQAGTAFQGCHQPSKLAMRVRFPSPAPRQNAISGGRQEAVCSCSVAVGQTSGPVEEVERVELSFVVGVGVDLERGG